MKRRTDDASRSGPGRLAGLVLAAAVSLAQAQSPSPGPLLDPEDFKIPMWNADFEVRGGVGYKDNVTLSPRDQADASGFWLSRAEVLLFRLPSQGWRFNVFATADDLRYFDAAGVDNEQVAMAVAQLGKDFGHGWKSTLGLNYLYQNQVFDLSATYTNGGSIGQIQGHLISPRLGTRKTLGPAWLEAELSGARQFLAEPLDSYWQTGPRLAAGWSYSRGSELSLAYTFSVLGYDQREPADLAGFPLTNSVLALQTHGVELAWSQDLDSAHRWQNTARVGWETTLDNGPGYYDYQLYRAHEQLRYRTAAWDVSAQAGVGFYNYAHQTVSATDLSPRQRVLLSFALRGEYRFSRHLKAHASYSLDRSLSGMTFDDYVAGTVLGGLAIDF